MTHNTAERDVGRLLATLRELLPDGTVSTDEDDRAAHAADRWPAAAKWDDVTRQSHAPVAVVRPISVADVSATIRAASSAGLAVIPYGGGSGVVGGAVPRRPAISIDLRGLAGPPEFDDEAGEVTVDAGFLAGDLERQLNARGRRLAHYPQSLHLATVGGLVATRSSGTFSSKYGNIEDLLVGLEVVLADGTVVATKASPRAATGPSLAQLFVGSEGTLGILTRITLRTFTVPERIAFRGVAFAGRSAGLGAGLGAVRSLLDRGIRPAVIRLYDPVEAAHLFERAGLSGEERSLLILGFDGAAPVVEAEQSVALAELVAHGGQDLGAEIGEAWERTRFDASWLDRGNAGAARLADAIEVSAPWPRLLSLYEQMLGAVEPYTDTSYAHYSHFYPNGGALYLIITTSAADTATAVDRYLAAWAAAIKAVHAAGGTMSHHHGVGEARREWMNEELGSSTAILTALKRALDPDNIFNPGKLGLTLETSCQEEQ